MELLQLPSHHDALLLNKNEFSMEGLLSLDSEPWAKALDADWLNLPGLESGRGEGEGSFCSVDTITTPTRFASSRAADLQGNTEVVIQPTRAQRARTKQRHMEARLHLEVAHKQHEAEDLRRQNAQMKARLEVIESLVVQDEALLSVLEKNAASEDKTEEIERASIADTPSLILASIADGDGSQYTFKNLQELTEADLRKFITSLVEELLSPLLVLESSKDNAEALENIDKVVQKMTRVQEAVAAALPSLRQKMAITNLSTGEESMAGEGHWNKVLGAGGLSKQQQSKINLALSISAARLSSIKGRRRELQKELSVLQLPKSYSAVGEYEALLKQMEATYQQETSICYSCDRYFMKELTALQCAKMMVISYPYELRVAFPVKGTGCQISL